MEIRELLLHLGVTPNYRAFSFLLTALDLLREDATALLLVTKRLYPAIAQRHGTTWRAVERNLRTAAALVWQRNPALLQELAGYPMTRKPTVSQLLAILLAQAKK